MPSERLKTRAEQAALLLSRLNDEDIRDERARHALRNLDNCAPLDMCIKLFFAWCSIAITAKKLTDADFELDEHWDQNLTFAYNHIIDLCVPELEVGDYHLFYRNIQTIFSNALHLNPYVGVAGYVDELDFSLEY